MKLTSIILLVLLTVYVTCIFATNLILKKQYDNRDKTDNHWNFRKIEKRPFKYLKVTGSDMGTIAFEPSIRSSVGFLDNWHEYLEERVRTAVKNDTLFLDILDRYSTVERREWLRSRTLIRIFSPELLYVEGSNVNIRLFKLNQKTLFINLSGKSQLEVESYLPAFDSISVVQRDSSKVEFEMAPELNASNTMQLKVLEAHIQGFSLLDVGHFRINSLHYTVGDTSAIILSGGTLKAVQK